MKKQLTDDIKLHHNDSRVMEIRRIWEFMDRYDGDPGTGWNIVKHKLDNLEKRLIPNLHFLPYNNGL